MMGEDEHSFWWSVVWLAPPQAVQKYDLLSEFTTLMCLDRIVVPSPTVHGYGLSININSVDVNYILIDKLEASPSGTTKVPTNVDRQGLSTHKHLSVCFTQAGSHS